MVEQIAPMKRVLLPIVVLLVVAPLAFAHVGSPNVFFEGRAGGYSVYAVVRPPAALPGAAQVSVRVQQLDIRSVSLLPVMWQAGRQGSPQPIAAQRVAGETNLWSAEVWLLRPGSYTMQIGIEGPRGLGEATVPVNAVGMQSQQMKPGLRVILLVSGLLLFLSAVFIVVAIAREGCLDPGTKPTALHHVRGRWGAGFAVLLLTAGVALGAIRWHSMALAYRTQGIQKPEPVTVAVRAKTDRAILELRQADQSVSSPSWTALVPDHGKLMHLFLIREPGLDVFAHLHPFRPDAHTFALDVPRLPAGGYQLYGDVTYENGISQTLIARVTLPEPVGAPLALPPLATDLAGEVICGLPPALGTNAGQAIRDMDDSWHVGQTGPTGFANRATVKHSAGGLVSRLMGGHTLFFENADAVAAGHETSLRFAAFAPDGGEAVLQLYMGMLGHAAVRQADGSVFAHLHPLGSFSMASQEAFRRRDSAIDPTNDTAAGNSPSPMSLPSLEKTPPNRVSFPYQFPKPGPYRLWIQVRIAGRVLTGVYDVEIKAGA
jgi:hypothetical protein